MRIRRLTALAATAVGAGILLLGPVAQATPTYPPSTPSISVSSTVVEPGSAVTVNGQGFQPLSGVALTWTGPGARGLVSEALPFGARALTASTAGAVTSSITFTATGQHVITLSGVDSAGAPVSLSATVTVRVAGAVGTLSHTGFPVTQALLVALGLLVVGILLVLAVRRRRVGSADASAPADAAAAPAQSLQPTP